VHKDRYLPADHAHEVRYRYTHARQHDSPILVRNVVVEPHIEDDTRCTCAPGHHEASEICDLELARDIHTSVNDHTRHGECEA